MLESKTPIEDVGNLDSALRAPIEEDAPEPIEIIARVIAHISHRLPGIRWIAKKFRLEGEGKSAGMGSDLISLLVQLYRRNEDTIKAVFAAEIQKFMDSKQKQSEQATVHPIQEVQ